MSLNNSLPASLDLIGVVVIHLEVTGELYAHFGTSLDLLSEYYSELTT
jgi:hypothetical protein